MKIRSSISCVLVELRSLTNQIQKKRMQARLIGSHLMRGFSGDFDSQVVGARTQLGNIVRNLEVAAGVRRDFYLAQLNEFKNRLTVLEQPKTKEQENAKLALFEEFRRALRQCHP